jgi:2,4-dienoyl-CoA reductase (NADPH2)
VNPRACYETELPMKPAEVVERVAVVGAGPAGMSAAITAAQRGHEVTLFDAQSEVGGQLNMAKQVPGKEEFWGLVDWYRAMLAHTGVHVRLGAQVDASTLSDFDHVIVATGVMPRDPQIAGQDAPNVVSYVDVLRGGAVVGDRVAIIGAGGIGFDVAETLSHDGTSSTVDLEAWKAEWGVGDPSQTRGGLAPTGPAPKASAREIILLQRKAEKVGKRLGKTTGWIHRAALKMKGVKMIAGVNYEQITSEGLHISYGPDRTKPEVLAVDTIVLCAGQLPERSLADQLMAAGKQCHVIGGAGVAAELDAKRAIDQGTRLAMTL